jgi:hypothetical protein
MWHRHVVPTLPQLHPGEPQLVEKQTCLPSTNKMVGVITVSRVPLLLSWAAVIPLLRAQTIELPSLNNSWAGITPLPRLPDIWETVTSTVSKFIYPQDHVVTSPPQPHQPTDARNTSGSRTHRVRLSHIYPPCTSPRQALLLARLGAASRQRLT